MVDGSKSSEGAFELCLAMFKRSSYFTLLRVIHVYDPSKTYLEDKYREQHLKEHFEHRLVSQLPKHKYSVDLVCKKTNSKNDAFREAQDSGCDTVFLGFHGRKGENGKEVTLLGSLISSASVFTHFPYVVYKEPLKATTLTCGVCFDGSKKSIEALNYTARLLGEADRLFVIYALHICPTLTSQGKRRASSRGGTQEELHEAV